MKTAVCFTGTCRALQHTYLNLSEYLIKTLGDCDVFMVISDNPHASKAGACFSALTNNKTIIVRQEEDHDLSGLVFRQNWPSGKLSSKQIYLKMIDSRQHCGQLLAEYELQNGCLYDRVIFSRLDVKYFANVGEIIDGLDMSKLHVPDFHNTFGGVVDGHNDRFAVGNRENMKAYFDLPDSLVPFVEDGGQIHAETLLKWHLTRNQIEVGKIPVRFTRVRLAGEEIDNRLRDTSTWGHGDT